ncbi:MAG: hypothetical protein A2Z12_03980 [Actinobacteria bacterium RBG_16_68_21]|nr:MAG: hypothetical protein A2Z12_03980 [Actinobacteria bacterium RBG_16_68_21]
MKPPLYILAGGKSSRFGSDKARAERDGLPLIVGIAQSLESATSDVTVVAAAAGAYSDLGLRTLGDIEVGKGPMGGLATAMDDLTESHDGDWLLLAACDLVDVDPRWVDLLTEHVVGVRAVAFRGADGWEPVFALYHTDLRTEIADRLEGGRRSLQALLDAVETAAVERPSGFRQVNRPADIGS